MNHLYHIRNKYRVGGKLASAANITLCHSTGQEFRKNGIPSPRNSTWISLLTMPMGTYARLIKASLNFFRRGYVTAGMSISIYAIDTSHGSR